MQFKQTLRTGLFATTALLLLFLFNACRKSNPTIQGTIVPYDNSTMVSASIFGVITDEGGIALEGAQISVKGYQTTTDVNGFYYFNNITIPQHATTVHVSKAGFFNGSRAMMVKAGQRHQFSLSLMKKENPQSFMSSNGGELSFAGGLKLSFPLNAVKNKTTGAAYAGQVFVYAKTINPTTAQGRNTMPGDLRGVTAAGGEERTLQSFGMFVAELFAPDGTPLQIADGKEVTMTLDVPNSIIGNAPATIPLWFYDAEKEMWVEEGSAMLVGNKYVGKVKHFSFWNCDTPQAANISIEMTFVDQNGMPLNGYLVKLTNTANNDARHGTTNASGWVGGLCYSNASLLLEVFDGGNVCSSLGVPIYSQTITTGSVNQNLGTLVVTVPVLNSTTITGSVVDCNNLPISNASILVSPYNILITPNASGNFSYTIPCLPTQPVTFVAYDLSNNVFGNSSSMTLITGNNNVGILNACGNISQFLNLTMTNTVTSVTMTKSFVIPVDTTSISVNLGNGTSNISAFAVNSQNNYLSFQAVDTTIGTHAVSSLVCFFVPSFTDTQFSLDPGSVVTFTTFPGFPGDVTGTFSINAVGNPSGNTYTLVGNFRLPRVN